MQHLIVNLLRSVVLFTIQNTIKGIERKCAMPTTKEIFARNLKNMLEARRKNQSDLARFLKMTPTAVSRWTNAEVLPRPSTIDRICGYLVCSAEDLMTDHTKTVAYAPQDIIADAIVERPLLMQLFLMADKASDDAILRCIQILGEK